MKKITLLLSLSLVLFLSSCDKKTIALMYDSFGATIGATNFDFSQMDKHFAAVGSSDQLTLTASGKGHDYIVLVINNYVKGNSKGTYTIGTSLTGANAAYHQPNATSDEIAVSGELIIADESSTGGYIMGTFDFTTSTGTHITNGTFTAAALQ